MEKNEEEPWVVLDLESEEHAQKLMSRSISTKYCVELWADGSSYELLHESLKGYPSHLSAPYCKEDLSFKINVEGFKIKLSFQDRIKRIESFDYLPTKGPVRMKNPDITFSNFEFWGMDNNNLSNSPQRLFFGRCIGRGQRDLITKLSIKSRKFIGMRISFV